MRGGPSRNELLAKRPSPRWQYRTTVAKFCQPMVCVTGRRALRHAFQAATPLLEQCEVLVAMPLRSEARVYPRLSLAFCPAL